MWSSWDGGSFRRNGNYCVADYTPILKKKKLNEKDNLNNQCNNNNNIVPSFSQNAQVVVPFSNSNLMNSHNLIQPTFQRPNTITTSKPITTPFITSFRSFNSSIKPTFYAKHVNSPFNFSVKSNSLSTKPIKNFNEPLFDSTPIIGMFYFFF